MIKNLLYLKMFINILELRWETILANQVAQMQFMD